MGERREVLHAQRAAIQKRPEEDRLKAGHCFNFLRIEWLRPRRRYAHGRRPIANAPRCRPDTDWLRRECSRARRAGLPRTDPDRSVMILFPLRIRCAAFSAGRSCRHRRALAKRVLQVDGNAVFFEHVGESFIGQFLDRRHPVAPKLRQFVESVVVEGDQFTHGLPAFCAATYFNSIAARLKLFRRGTGSARCRWDKKENSNDQNIRDPGACRNRHLDISDELVRTRCWQSGQRQRRRFASRRFGGRGNVGRQRRAVRPGQCRRHQQFRQRPERRRETRRRSPRRRRPGTNSAGTANSSGSSSGSGMNSGPGVTTGSAGSAPGGTAATRTTNQRRCRDQCRRQGDRSQAEEHLPRLLIALRMRFMNGSRQVAES